MPNQAVLIRTLVEMADSLLAEFDAVELITLLCDRCVEVLDVASAGVMLATPAGRLQVVASSNDAMRTLELFQLQSDQGPCIDAYRSGERVINQDLNTNIGRWPKFSPHAIAAGFHSTHSLPMHIRGQTIGALNMFRSSIGTLEPDDFIAAQALADVAPIVIIQHNVLLSTQTLNEQLNNALNSRIVIEQAKGKISQANSLDMDHAFQRLRQHARNHNLRLTDVARDIAAGTIPPASLDVCCAPLRSQ